MDRRSFEIQLLRMVLKWYLDYLPWIEEVWKSTSLNGIKMVVKSSTMDKQSFEIHLPRIVIKWYLNFSPWIDKALKSTCVE